MHACTKRLLMLRHKCDAVCTRVHSTISHGHGQGMPLYSSSCPNRPQLHDGCRWPTWRHDSQHPLGGSMHTYVPTGRHFLWADGRAALMSCGRRILPGANCPPVCARLHAHPHSCAAWWRGIRCGLQTTPPASSTRRGWRPIPPPSADQHIRQAPTQAQCRPLMALMMAPRMGRGPRAASGRCQRAPASCLAL